MLKFAITLYLDFQAWCISGIRVFCDIGSISFSNIENKICEW